MGCSQPTSPSKYVRLGGKASRSKSKDYLMGMKSRQVAPPSINIVKSRSPKQPEPVPFKNTANIWQVISHQKPVPSLVVRSPSPQRVLINNKLVNQSINKPANQVKPFQPVHQRMESDVVQVREAQL